MVTTGFGGVVLCSNVVVLFNGVRMVCVFLCVAEEWGFGVRAIDGLCTLVVVVFARGFLWLGALLVFWARAKKRV